MYSMKGRSTVCIWCTSMGAPSRTVKYQTPSLCCCQNVDVTRYILGNLDHFPLLVWTELLANIMDVLRFIYTFSCKSPMHYALSDFYECLPIGHFKAIVFFVCSPSDEDECKIGSAKCHYKANCTNTAGSYKCDCHRGYRGNGQVCTGEKVFVDFNLEFCRKWSKQRFN